MAISVIDLFAGGLGEGFSSLRDDDGHQATIVVSYIGKDGHYCIHRASTQNRTFFSEKAIRSGAFVQSTWFYRMKAQQPTMQSSR